MNDHGLTAVELCAGAGGQALGVEQAGFLTAAAVEIDDAACETLRMNRPGWEILESDLREVSGRPFRGVDLVAGGVPCPPFSIAGQQKGPEDERDLFPEALRFVEQARPAAVMLENVRGLASSRFLAYREGIIDRLRDLGYQSGWRVFQASDFGVPQLRPRFILVALRKAAWKHFEWPAPRGIPAPTVGECLEDLMGQRGWKGTKRWVKLANGIAPTLVGGSKKHGGPDLGPTRARREWARLGVNGLSLADEAPGAGDPAGLVPRLTVRMTARLQGFPDGWAFSGRKTRAYRQVGNAFPPPVAHAVASAIAGAIASGRASCKAAPRSTLSA